MQSPHFSLENAIRPTIFNIPAYITSTSDEFQPRSTILLDANENSLGSCLAPCTHSKIYTNGHTHENGLTNGHTNGYTNGNTNGHTNGYMNGYTNGNKNRNKNDHLNNLPRKDSPGLAFSESIALHRYPSASQWQLKSTIAKWRGLPDAKHICLGVGAADIIDLIIRMTCTPFKDAIMITPPTFGFYQSRADLSDVEVVECPLELEDSDKMFTLRVDDMLDQLVCNPQVKVIFIASPGNPTGTFIPLDDIKRILGFPGYKGIVVVDEAYIDFCCLTGSAVNLLPEYQNLVVVQTLSKSHGLAGLRLGMGFAHPAIIQMFQKIQIPYCVSTTTSALAMLALSPVSNQLHVQLTAQMNANRETLIKALGQADSTIGRPLGGNHANFIVLPVLKRAAGTAAARDDSRAKKVAERLKKEHDISVRWIGGLLGCEGCLRITVGTWEENEQLVKSLVTVLEHC